MRESAADYTRRLLRGGARAQKALGQNFLMDDRVIDQIIEASELSPDTPVVEIGPGLGVLTRVLAQKVEKLWAVELDQTKVRVLKKELDAQSLEILQGDALTLNLRELWGDRRGYLIGNLPYYITSPLLNHFIAQAEFLTGMTVMVQKEVADRIIAQPGTKAYGILSIAIQLGAEPTKALEVPARAFWPVPKVDSAVLKLKIRPYPNFRVELEAFFRLVKGAFAQRRKNLGNSLSAGLNLPKGVVLTILSEAGVSGERRAETLSIEEFQLLTEAFAGYGHIVAKGLHDKLQDK